MPATAAHNAARRLAALVVPLALVAAIAACGASPVEPVGQGIQGTGEVVEDVRDLAPFTRVSVAAGMKVIIGEADTQRVTVSAQQNLLGAISTEVRDGQLIVTLSEPVNATRPMSLTLRMGTVESVALAAGCVGFLEHTGGTINIDVSAGAELTAIGDTTRLTLTASSGSHAKLAELAAQYAEISVNDGATVEINVTTRVTGVADGGSTVILATTAATEQIETKSGATVQRP